MEQDEHQPQDQSAPEMEAARDLTALWARVDALERELAELRASHRTPAQTSPHPKTRVLSKRALKSRPSLEDRIGSQLFSRIGIVALLIATALFLKWAIDNHWVGPLGRILAGLIAGAALILWSERFRRRGFPAFSYSLKAIGSGAFYLSLWAAFQLYHLLPLAIGLGAMALVTAWNAYMAWSQDSEILAAYALAGAFLTPLLLASGGNHEVSLFTYLLVIDIATVALVRLKLWPRLLLGAFPATVAYFIAWYVGRYVYFGTEYPAAITALFVALFFVLFVTPALRTVSSGEQIYTPITEIFLPPANAAFAALALYSVLHDSGRSDLLPWVAVLLAAVYLALHWLHQARVTSAVHLTLAIVFLTIAIPLKASGRWITVGWLAEGVALLWMAARLTQPTSSTSLEAAHTLRRLAAIALLLGFGGLLVQPLWSYPAVEPAFLNGRFATAIFGLVALAACTAIAVRAHRPEATVWPRWITLAAACTIALNLVALFAFVRELDATWPSTAGNPDADLQKALAISAFLMVYGGALLAAGFWKRSAFVRWQALVLLVFTIGKTFLYDLRNLSQGYRVLSFLGLGALLMAVSFAYQKDWLALRETGAAADERTAQAVAQKADQTAQKAAQTAQTADQIAEERGANP